MCRPLFFHYESVATALEENLPTPFGIFLEANAKPARGCWHELLKRGASSLSFSYCKRHSCLCFNFSVLIFNSQRFSSSLTLSYSQKLFYRHRYRTAKGCPSVHAIKKSCVRIDNSELFTTFALYECG